MQPGPASRSSNRPKGRSWQRVRTQPYSNVEHAGAWSQPPAFCSALGEATDREVKFEMRRHDKEALEFDVTRCRFAEFFRALGEPELGALLICETDFDIASAGGSEVSLDRAQTSMQGARSCTFRYKFAPR